MILYSPQYECSLQHCYAVFSAALCFSSLFNVFCFYIDRRVRVALALKGVTYEYVPVNILSVRTVVKT